MDSQSPTEVKTLQRGVEGAQLARQTLDEMVRHQQP